MRDPFLRPQFSPLAYPAGVAPGFDPTHVAAGRGPNGAFNFSCVSSGGSQINLLSGKPGTATGSNAGVDARIGAVTKYTGATNVTTFPYTTTSLGSTIPITFGCIGSFTALTTGANTAVYLSTVTNTGIGILNAGSVFYMAWGGANVSTTIAAGANVPYFFAASSMGGLTINYVVLRFDTGQVYTFQSGATGPGSAGDGNLYIGNRGGIRVWQGGISAAMAQPVYLSMPQLLQWASDPWSFWYPRRQYNYVGAAAIVSGAKFRRTLSNIGTRTGTRQVWMG